MVLVRYGTIGLNNGHSGGENASADPLCVYFGNVRCRQGAHTVSIPVRPSPEVRTEALCRCSHTPKLYTAMQLQRVHNRLWG
jgi:hypothetical protein